MKIKALTLWQPWASLMAMEEKKIETRSWKTKYRGLLAIHAAKRPLRTPEIELYNKAFCDLGLKLPSPRWALPFGEIVAVVELKACWQTPGDDHFKTMLDVHGGVHESLFGNYAKGRYAWITKMVYAVPYNETYNVNGQRGLWDWEVPPGTKMELAIKKYQEEKV